MEKRVYTINRSTITLQTGDITESRAEVIVSSDDGDITRGGGVSLAIGHAAGGPPMREIRKHIPARVGDVVVTEAGNLPAKYILHAITIPAWTRSVEQAELRSGAIVRATVQRVMDILPLLRCRSVAFPVIGAGLAGVAFEDAAREMSEVLVRKLLDSPEDLRVELFLYDRLRKRSGEELSSLFEAAIQSRLGIDVGQQGGSSAPDSTADDPSAAGQPPTVAQRRQDILSTLLYLGRQRDQLERDLLATLTDTQGLSTEKLAGIRSKLEEIERLRAIYLRELTPATRGAAEPNTVFLSSTYMDLQPQRQAVRGVIEGLKLRCVGMEDFTPEAVLPGEYIRRQVEKSEVYLGLLGMRYGAIDEGSGLSMTELEYRQAVASNKPRLMFVMDLSAPITVDMVEMNSQSFAKLMEFRNHVLKSHICAMFCDLNDLTSKVQQALRSYEDTLR